MANLFWTIVPFVLTFGVATWTRQASEPQPVPARCNSQRSHDVD